MGGRGRAPQMERGQRVGSTPVLPRVRPLAAETVVQRQRAFRGARLSAAQSAARTDPAAAAHATRSIVRQI